MAFSLDFGLKEFGEMDSTESFRRYRRFVYETGAMDKGKGAQIDSKITAQERYKNFELSHTRHFMYRTRYFTDAGIIGGKEFVSQTHQRVINHFQPEHKKIPKPISGLQRHLLTEAVDGVNFRLLFVPNSAF